MFAKFATASLVLVAAVATSIGVYGRIKGWLYQGQVGHPPSLRPSALMAGNDPLEESRYLRG